MAKLSDEAKGLLGRPIFAFATVVRSNGSLHSTVVWVDSDGDDVIFNTAVGRVKERILRRDPRVSISVVDPEDGFHALSVFGRAELELEGADEVINRLSHKYTGRDYGGRGSPEQRVTVRVAPESVIYSPGRRARN